MSILSSVMIKLKGDSTGAVAALDDVQDKARQTEKAVEQVSTSSGAAGAAMGGLAAAAAAVAVAVSAVTSTIGAYAESNQQAGDTMLGLSETFKSVQVAIGGALFQSDAFQAVLGSLGGVMIMLRNNADSIANVLAGTLRFALNSVIVVVDSLAFAWAGLRTILTIAETSIQLILLAMESYVRLMVVAATTAIDFGLAFSSGVVRMLNMGIEAVQGFLVAAQPLANYAGIDLGPAVESLGSLSNGLDGAVTGLENMRAAVQGVRSDQIVEIVENGTQALDTMSEGLTAVVGHWRVFGNILDATGSSTTGVVEQLEETGRAAREATSGGGGGVVELTKALRELYEMNQLLKEQSESRAGNDAAKAAVAEQLRIQQIEQEKYEATRLLQEKELADEVSFRERRDAMFQAAAQQRADALKAEATAALEARQMINDSIMSSLVSVKQVGEGMLGALVSGNRRAIKEMAKSAAQALKIQAITQGALGLLNLIPPPWNPFGNPVAGKAQLAGAAAAGAGAVVLSGIAGLSGGGGSNGGSSLSASGTGSAPITSNNTRNTNVTYNNQLAFGVVGDPRATAKLVVDSLQFASAEGMIR